MWVCVSTLCESEGNSFTIPDPFRSIKMDVLLQQQIFLGNIVILDSAHLF